MTSDDVKESVLPDEHTFDIDAMPTTDKLVSLHQEGNYIVGTTELGTNFRQHIPVGKVLNKNSKGEWILENLRI